MKRFLITYTFRLDPSEVDAWHARIAEAENDEAIQSLVQQDFFKAYTEETKRVGGGHVDVSPLETIAETRGK